MQGKNLSPTCFSPSSKDSYGLIFLIKVNCMECGSEVPGELCQAGGSIPCIREEDPAGCLTAFCQEKCTVGFKSLEAL